MRRLQTGGRSVGLGRWQGEVDVLMVSPRQRVHAVEGSATGEATTHVRVGLVN